MSTVFKGSGVALVTPFTNGEVDYTALTRLIELQIISGTDAIIVCGTTGEAATLTAEERLEVIRFVVERVNRRLPVIAGTGGNNTAAVIEASRTAEALGVELPEDEEYDTLGGLIFSQFTVIPKDGSTP